MSQDYLLKPINAANTIKITVKLVSIPNKV